VCFRGCGCGHLVGGSGITRSKGHWLLLLSLNPLTLIVNLSLQITCPLLQITSSLFQIACSLVQMFYPRLVGRHVDSLAGQKVSGECVASEHVECATVNHRGVGFKFKFNGIWFRV
jgi:hypothetical protein